MTDCYCRRGPAIAASVRSAASRGIFAISRGRSPTRGWCEAHYAVLDDRMEAGVDLTQPYGLRDADRICFRSPGRRRWLFWWGDSFVMEFRSQWLARCIAVAPSGRR